MNKTNNAERNRILQSHPMWRKPQHHLDTDEDNEHVHWMELFYDLVHVVTIFLLGNFLSHHLDLNGFINFTFIFIALWFAWAELSVYNSIFVSTDFWHRAVMSMLIVSVMFMAAAIPSINGGGWPFFALAYATNRFLIAFLYFRARRVDAESSSMTNLMIRQMVVFGVLYAVTAFIPKPYCYWAFCLGLLLNQLTYIIPATSLMRKERFVPRFEHLAERFGLLTLIVLGESFFKLVVTLSDKGIYKVGPDILANFTFGGIGTFVMAWLYFDLVGNGKIKENNISASVGVWLAHITLMLSAVMVGVALAAEVKVGWDEHYPYGYAVIGCVGLAGFIASLGVIQNCIEPRLAHRFTGWGVKGFGIVMAFVTLWSVPYVTSFWGNILWGIALFSQLVIPLTRSFNVLRREEEEAA